VTTGNAAQDSSLEGALDQWALVLEAIQTTGYRDIEKAIVGLEVTAVHVRRKRAGGAKHERAKRND
jgi:hypothetical protein